MFYRRYVDDTFLLFRASSHVEKFNRYLNAQHSRIKFTVEREQNGSLPFLDVFIQKNGTGFETSTYRKPTFTGLGTKANSAVSPEYKQNFVDCLVNRARKINSNALNLGRELIKLKIFFCQNGFSFKWVEKRISKILNKPIPAEPIPNVPKKDIFCNIPYMSISHNKDLKIKLSKLVSDYYPQLNLRIIFSNNDTIGKMFPYKDCVPSSLRSNVVYKFQCSVCNSTYIGETIRHYKTRISEHMGISPLTGAPIISKTNVREHINKTGHIISEQDFKIIKNSTEFDVKTAESICIHSAKPNLNSKITSVPLFILE